jgi:hypothetical protein
VSVDPGKAAAETLRRDSPWENRFVIGVVLVIGLLAAIAALIAALGSSDKGWFAFCGLLIALAFGAVLAIGLLVLLIRDVLIPVLRKLTEVIEKNKAPGLLPALLAAMQGVFIAANDEILNGDPTLKFALSAIIAMVSFLGVLFAELHRDTWMTMVGIFLVIVAVGPVAFVAITHKHWWSHYSSMSATNQIAFVGSIAICIVIPITAIMISRRVR